MHDNPRPSEKEQELARSEPEEHDESMRYPESHDPDERPDGDEE